MAGVSRDGGEHRGSDEIRQDIEQTRVLMDNTLVALREKLSAHGLLEQARQVLQDALRRPRILQTLRVSPGVAAVAVASLVGAGASIAYLLAEGASEETLLRSEAKKYVEHLPRQTAGGRMVEPGQEPHARRGGRIISLLHQWRDRVRWAPRGGQRAAPGGREPTAPPAGESEPVPGHIHDARRAGWHKAVQSAHEALARTQEHPLAAAAAGVAAGVLLGVVLPGWPDHHAAARRGKEPRRPGKECFQKAEQLTPAPPDAPEQTEGQPAT